MAAGTDENSKSKITSTGCQDSVACSGMVEQHLAELIGRLLKKAMASLDAHDQEIRSAAGAFDLMDALVDKNQAAAFMGVTVRTLEMWMRKGFPHYKIHRCVQFRRRNLWDYLENKCKI
jgi:hypothetical protein